MLNLPKLTVGTIWKIKTLIIFEWFHHISFRVDSKLPNNNWQISQNQYIFHHLYFLILYYYFLNELCETHLYHIQEKNVILTELSLMESITNGESEHVRHCFEESKGLLPNPCGHDRNRGRRLLTAQRGCVNNSQEDGHRHKLMQISTCWLVYMYIYVLADRHTSVQSKMQMNTCIL